MTQRYLKHDFIGKSKSAASFPIWEIQKMKKQLFNLNLKIQRLHFAHPYFNL